MKEELTKKESKLSATILGFALITSLIGAIEDIISAGQDFGYLFPIALFSIFVVLLILS